jgi:hypothetical protein
MSTIKWMREHALVLSGTILGISLAGLLISLSYFFLMSYVPDPVTGIIEAPGAWNYWIILLSSFGVIIGGWYFYDTKKKMKKFEELMETKSKSKFTRNLAELEDIAWHLGQDYEDRLTEKKRKLRIK